MRLIDDILDDDNLMEARRRVKGNKGAPGIDKKTVEENEEYFKKHKLEILKSIRDMTYEPKPVRRVYIPKNDGKKRPLGIPTARR